MAQQGDNGGVPPGNGGLAPGAENSDEERERQSNEQYRKRRQQTEAYWEEIEQKRAMKEAADRKERAAARLRELMAVKEREYEAEKERLEQKAKALEEQAKRDKEAADEAIRQRENEITAAMWEEYQEAEVQWIQNSRRADQQAARERDEAKRVLEEAQQQNREAEAAVAAAEEMNKTAAAAAAEETRKKTAAAAEEVRKKEKEVTQLRHVTGQAERLATQGTNDERVKSALNVYWKQSAADRARQKREADAKKETEISNESDQNKVQKELDELKRSKERTEQQSATIPTLARRQEQDRRMEQILGGPLEQTMNRDIGITFREWEMQQDLQVRETVTDNVAERLRKREEAERAALELRRKKIGEELTRRGRMPHGSGFPPPAPEEMFIPVAELTRENMDILETYYFGGVNREINPGESLIQAPGFRRSRSAWEVLAEAVNWDIQPSGPRPLSPVRSIQPSGPRPLSPVRSIQPSGPRPLSPVGSVVSPWLTPLSRVESTQPAGSGQRSPSPVGSSALRAGSDIFGDTGAAAEARFRRQREGMEQLERERKEEERRYNTYLANQNPEEVIVLGLDEDDDDDAGYEQNRRKRRREEREEHEDEEAAVFGGPYDDRRRTGKGRPPALPAPIMMRTPRAAALPLSDADKRRRLNPTRPPTGPGSSGGLMPGGAAANNRLEPFIPLNARGTSGENIWSSTAATRAIQETQFRNQGVDPKRKRDMKAYIARRFQRAGL